DPAGHQGVPGDASTRGGRIMTPRVLPHRETLQACIRIVSTAETLEDARTQLARLLIIFDKLRGENLTAGMALDRAEERVPTCPRGPGPGRRDSEPIRRRVAPTAPPDPEPQQESPSCPPQP